MSESKYIGRAEMLTKGILFRLLKCIDIQEQVPIKKIISTPEYNILDQEIKNHKFDLVVWRNPEKPIVVEVNYKHGPKADFKWNEIFVPLIKKSNIIPLPINDYECETLFKKSVDGTHKITWQDYMDVMNCMVIVGIEPKIDLE